MAEPTRVLISYSHDTPAHAAAVLRLADALRAAGVDARLDQYTPTPRLGWPQWMQDELREAAFIVCVCTATYRQRFEQQAPSGEGLGASWEGMLATLLAYRTRDLGKLVPVLLSGASEADVPDLLFGQPRYALPDPTPTEPLLRHLLRVPAATMPPLGPLPEFARRSGGPVEPPTREDVLQALTFAIDSAPEQDLAPANVATLTAALHAARDPDEADLAPGDLLGGRYKLSRRLGHGGIATVWSAFDQIYRGRQREVAVKVLHVHHLKDRTVLDRFRKGGADHATVEDPGVIKVLDPWGEADGRCWIVLELLTGGDLDQAVRHGNMAPLEAVRLCLDVGHTLARLHARQLIHADVKPANILLTADRQPRLADFDLAKNLAMSMVGTTRRLGDPLFSCPEQQDGEDVHPSWDVYGISVTALWCASGGTLTKKAWRKGNYPPLPLPDAVLAVLKRGAATDPEDRIADVATWCRELEAALAERASAETADAADAVFDDDITEEKPPRRAAQAPAAPGAAKPPAATTPPASHIAGPTAKPQPPTPASSKKAHPRPPPLDDLRRRLAATAIAPPADPTNPATLAPGARRTLLLPGDVPLDLAWIPAGTFWMGSPDGVGDGDERPRHQVTLSRPYWLGVTPVTQAQWAAVAATLPALNATPSHFKGADRPVEKVSWDDARAWCNALSACLGLPLAYPDLTNPDTINWTAGARLPTEAEWERACRAGTDTAWSFGDDAGALAAHARFDKGWDDGTAPVGELLPNPWGLLDVHGNVREWCWDGWLRNYTAQPVIDPRHPPSASGDRCARGGAFNYSAGRCRSAYRDYWDPTWRDLYQGLRVVVPAPADALTLVS
jgi:formylglycine-generating enzyme required for sulfatase activity/serine/threonine protein kinase